MLERVWEGRAVEENKLMAQMSVLRKALGEKTGEHRFIVTVAGEGYKFVGELAEGEKAAIDHLEKESDARGYWAGMYVVAPEPDELRNDLRFKAMRKKMNLPE